MTSIDLQTKTTRSNSTQRDAGRAKSLLFCPVCGHESPVDGDWCVANDDSHDHDVVCPNCGQVVATR